MENSPRIPSAISYRSGTHIRRCFPFLRTFPAIHVPFPWTANRWITAGRFPADAPGPDAVISTVPDAAFHITDAHTGPDGLPHFYIATALGPDRFFCLAVNARLFNAFLEEFRLGRTGEVFLINAEGVLQSRSVLHGALLNRVDGLAGQSPDKVYARTWGGTRLWSAVLPVTAHSGWRIVAQWDEREMTQSADARLIPRRQIGRASCRERV